MKYKRGDIFYADLGLCIGSEQGGVRPVMIVSNNIGNYHSPTVIVAPITKKMKKSLPTHVHIENKESGLKSENNVLLAEQVKTLDKTRLKEKRGTLRNDLLTMQKVCEALKISQGL